MQFKIEAIRPYEVSQITQIQQMPESAKIDLIKQNPDILQNIQIRMNKADFAYLMKNRPLIRFRPLKNSFVKQGDKALLAESLNIPVSQVKSEIAGIIDSNFELKDRITNDYIAKVRTYIYRHGAKDEVLAFLENELSDVKTTLQSLYKTLDDNTGGLCGYFQRPCHRMDNETLEKIYNIIDGSLNNAQNAGVITSSQSKESADWALKQIYKIQNDSKVIRAAKVVYNNE